eukprot:g14826.t1
MDGGVKCGKPGVDSQIRYPCYDPVGQCKQCPDGESTQNKVGQAECTRLACQTNEH